MFLEFCPPLPPSPLATPENKYINSSLSSDTQVSTHKVRKSASPLALSRAQLVLHATRQTPQGVSRWMRTMLARPVKTRRALSRYCRDARINGLETTAMHDMSTPPPLRARARATGTHEIRLCLRRRTCSPPTCFRRAYYFCGEICLI